MSLPTYSKERTVTAWGETRRVVEWAEDERCEVSYVTILERLMAGLSPETAITLPNQRRSELTLWGETKRVYQWAEDERAAEGVTAEHLYHRLALGWTPLEALTTTPETQLPVELTAWGETLTVAEWSRDPRCVVERSTLYSRVEGGWDPVAALTTPALDRGLELTAWGETHTRSEWLQDERCVVDRGTLESRLDRGWTPARALSEDPTPRQWILDGEALSVSELLEDPRCVVSDDVLRGRLYTLGWDVHRALATPTAERKAEVALRAWGETQLLIEWAEDPRCQVTLGTLRARLKRGWEPERALGEPTRTGHTLTAWGETRTLREWLEDPRCNVTTTKALLWRMKRGWAPERVVGG